MLVYIVFIPQNQNIPFSIFYIERQHGSKCANRACFLCSALLHTSEVRGRGGEKCWMRKKRMRIFFFPPPTTAVLGNRSAAWVSFPSPNVLMVWTPSSPALARFKCEGGAFKLLACQHQPPGSFELIWCHQAFSPWPICLSLETTILCFIVSYVPDYFLARELQLPGLSTCCRSLDSHYIYRHESGNNLLISATTLISVSPNIADFAFVQNLYCPFLLYTAKLIRVRV